MTLLSLGMLLGLVTAPGTPAAAAPPTGTPDLSLVAGSGAEPAAVDVASAVMAAEQLGEPVEALDMTTGTERHLANPDGTMTYESFALPQRVSKPAGWVPVDTTLRVAGGRVVPEATVLDVSLSAGGSGELARLVDGDRRLGLSWPAPLPVPVLSGDTATYREVMPGVDLVVRVEPDSFAQALVVRTRQAAENPALARVAWTVSAEGLALSVAEDGSVTAVDQDTHEAVFVAPPSVMSDSPPDQPGLTAAADADRGPGLVATMPVELAGDELAVLPDRELLASPETVYPVWIDPSFSRSVTNWAPVFRERPTSSWSSGTSSPREYVRVGLLNWPGCGSWCGLWRSHLRFTISSISGEQLIGNPDFRITLTHSASCNATPVALWRTNTIGSSGATWNKMSDKWLTNFGTRSASANKSDCPQDDAPMEWSTSTMRSRLQGAMDSGNSTFTFGLRAASEGDRFQWKRFRASSARLVATYNRPPLKPDRLAIDADCYLQCGSPAVVRTRRPFLEARVRDPHGASLRADFQVRSGSTVVASGTVSNVSSGGTARWRPGSNLPQERLTFRLRARNAHLTGPWSSNFTFTTDTSAPAMPTVSSGRYRHKDTGTWNGGVGQTGSFTFSSASSDVIEYGYRWLGGSETRVRVSEGASHVIEVAPASDLEQVLEVRALDAAGNISGWRSYPFLVRPQPADVAYWKFDEGAGGVAAPATGESAYAGALQGGATWAAAGINPEDPAASGGAVSLDGAGAYVEMPRVVATNHAAGFTVTAWVNPDELTGYHTVAAQHGEQTYAFSLYHKPETQQWCFRSWHADDPSAGNSAACATQPPQAGTWTHLAAVYDAPAGKLRLWVNGGPNNGEPTPGEMVEVDAPAMWASAGAFTVGQRNATDFFSGRIDEVRAHQRVLGEFEIQHTFLQCRYASCPPVPEPADPVLVGRWDMDDGAGPTATDSSGLGYDATLAGDAAWTAAGHDGTPGIRFGETAGWLDAGEQIVVADQSFTVSAWVKLEQLTGGEQWVVQAYGEVEGSAYKLYYQESTNMWRFALVSPDGDWRVAATPATSQLDEWIHLAGVYDRATGEVRLYVNGGLAATTGGAIGQPVVSNLYIGSSISGNFRVAGTVDSVRAYQSALTGAQVAALFAGGLS